MKFLYFADILVVDTSLPSKEDRRERLLEWAQGNSRKWAIAHLAYENEGENIEDYLFQIGFPLEESIVTTKSAIMEISGEVIKANEELLLDHLELYYSKFNSIPPWGTSEYRKLRAEGYTERTLIGPHKAGLLRPNEKRLIIISSSGEFSFGPLLPKK